MKELKKTYPSIERLSRKVREALPEKDVRLAELFDNCISDTLQKTIRFQEDGSVFMVTGDIPAMWLRDSACQLLPFLHVAGEETDIMDIFLGLIRSQCRFICIDPYANAFNETANGAGWQQDRTRMLPELWERKYEIDSLCHPIHLSWLLWKETGQTAQFTQEWKAAAARIIKTFRTEQDHENRSDYLFERTDCPPSDTLPRNGKGSEVKGNTGLIWSGFRPSDDACVYGYLIPSNIFAVIALDHIHEICSEIFRDAELADAAAGLAGEVREGIRKYGLVEEEKPFYAYEVDGFGNQLIMDDSNIPSLLALPFMGWCSSSDPLYLNTRQAILSFRNPYYYEGTCLKGVGSPHTPPDYVWDIALAIQGLTAATQEEKYACLRMMADNDDGTGLMHEGIHKDDPSKYTRPWFSWANSMFCELLLNYCGLT